jgi:hypothetical protein
MLQVFYLDVSKVDFGEAHADASAPPWVTAPLMVLLRRACGHVK